jgi:hypothetical protein
MLGFSLGTLHANHAGDHPNGALSITGAAIARETPKGHRPDRAASIQTEPAIADAVASPAFTMGRRRRSGLGASRLRTPRRPGKE